MIPVLIADRAPNSDVAAAIVVGDDVRSHRLAATALRADVLVRTWAPYATARVGIVLDT